MFTNAPSFLKFRSEKRIANFGCRELTKPLNDDAFLSPPAAHRRRHPIIMTIYNTFVVSLAARNLL